MGRIAVISGTSTIDVLKRLGHSVVYLNDWVPVSMALQADAIIEIELDDWQQVKEKLAAFHRRLPLDAVITNKQNQVALAAYLADQLQVSGLSVDAAQRCNDKGEMRRILNAAGVSKVAFEMVTSVEEIESAAGRIQFPVVVKPFAGSGSQGVQYCQDIEALYDAANNIWSDAVGEDAPQKIIIEEFLDGPQLTVDAIIRKGEPEIVAILQNDLGGFPRFVTTGFKYPADISQEERNEVVATVQRALVALGVNCGNAHVEVRLTKNGVKVIEVNLRAPGGRIREVVEAVTGVDLLTEGIASVIGDRVYDQAPKAAYCAYRSLFVEESGVLRYNEEALDEGALLQWNGLPPIVEMDVSPGEQVLAVSEEVGVLGRVVVFGNDQKEVAEDMKRICEKLALRVEAARCCTG